MYLKSLTLKGFKSFASASTFKLEPGICAIVGPNGSGKSNVVDALAWVMGEHSAKTLRGGKMEDVIFAGAGERKPLGRAEVTLTIDNSDAALPIEFSEVSVTRRMFRDGVSEYEINGSTARLMDVQELLSDTGIGREMHVIVGQGRLAQILESKPEERRAFIEEAAGVLKHKRRKEKAQRKLVNMQANVDRLSDLTTELHKQLGPLSRQAEAAKKASSVQATIRSMRVQLAAHRVQHFMHQLSDATAAAQAAQEKDNALQAQREEHGGRLRKAEEERQASAVAAEEARSLWFRLSAVAEKNAATVRIASDRAQMHAGSTWTGQDPEEIARRAERAEEDKAQCDEAVRRATAELQLWDDRVAECEAQVRRTEEEHLARARAIADRREGVVRLLSQHEAATAAVESAQADLQRHQNTVEQFQETVHAAGQELEHAKEAATALGAGGVAVEQDAQRAAREADGADSRVEELRAQQLMLEKEIATLQATISVWKEQMRPTDPATVVTSTAQQLGMDTRSLAEIIGVQDRWKQALAVALGDAASAVVLHTEAQETGDARERADEILAAVISAAKGRAVLLEPHRARGWRLEATPAHGRWLLDYLSIPAQLELALSALLVDVVAVDTLAQGRGVVAEDPRLRAVTPEGTLVGAGWSAAGTGETSAVELVSRVAAAQDSVEKKEEELADVTAALHGAREAAEECRTASATARAALHAHDVSLTGAQRHEAAAAAAHETAMKQLKRAHAEAHHAHTRLQEARSRVEQLADRVARLDEHQPDNEASTEERDAAAAALAQTKAHHMDARLALRTAEERAAAARNRAAGLWRQARSEQHAREQFLASQQRLIQAQRTAVSVVEQAQRVGQRIQLALRRADEQREAADARLKRGEDSLRQQKQTAVALDAQHQHAKDAAHQAELARAEIQVTLEQAVETAMERVGMATEQLMAQELAADFDPKHARSQLAQAEKALNALGKVNPLALEEFAALEERYTFLVQQLEDVRQAREDLHTVIKEVDATIVQLFTDAYKDVEEQFPAVFATLFPGGSGRLVLTDPEDMLTTGIDVEARPPGKKVKRLTLLSGGEKSLTALAFLVAIFRARPSPFYVMDEVEAALDDVNLRRLIALFEQLRKDSQLIVITHQKPTMDVANVLYGVTMRGDGVTTVISQRMQPVLRED